MAMSPTIKSDRDYQAEDDFRTLERAHEVVSDKSRHGAAKKHGRKKLSSIRKVMAGATLSAKRR